MPLAATYSNDIHLLHDISNEHKTRRVIEHFAT